MIRNPSVVPMIRWMCHFSSRDTNGLRMNTTTIARNSGARMTLPSMMRKPTTTTSAIRPSDAQENTPTRRTRLGPDTAVGSAS